MNLRCLICGEPWDFDTLHVEAEDRYYEQYGVSHREEHAENRELANQRYQPIFETVSAEFRSKGCTAIGSCSHNEQVNPEAATAALAMYELCGDDMDGAAALLEDGGF